MKTNSNELKTVCLIPARGGSKRLPGKNIMDFCGKPLLTWSILQAQKSGYFGKDIFVSTDDTDIYNTAIDFGATGIIRPSELAQDNTPTKDVVEHFLNIPGMNADVLILLQPTNPLRYIQNIRQVVDELTTGGRSTRSVITGYIHDYVSTHTYYPFKTDLSYEKIYAVTGLVYGIKTEKWEDLCGYRGIAFNVARWQSMEIDTAEDFMVCEALFAGMGLDKEVL